MRGSFIGARETSGAARLMRCADAAGAACERFGIYIFLISFTSVYYVSNAPVLLGHTDLGWTSLPAI